MVVTGKNGPCISIRAIGSLSGSPAIARKRPTDRSSSSIWSCLGAGHVVLSLSIAGGLQWPYSIWNPWCCVALPSVVAVRLVSALGTGYTAMGQTPAIGHSMQHPSTDPLAPAATAGGRKWQAFNRPAERIEPPVSDRVVDAVVGGTGRSQGHAGLSALQEPVFSASRSRTLRSSSETTRPSSILVGGERATRES